MQKKLNKGEVFSVLMGAIIGWGAFMLPGSKFLYNSGVINTSIGIFLGTMSIIIIERSYWFMLRQDIDEGGEFSYILIFMGSRHAFVVGWFLFLAYLSPVALNATAFPLIVDKLVPGILNFGYLYSIAAEPIYVGKILVSALAILFFCVLNLRGIKSSGKAQVWIVAALIAGVLAVFIGMLLACDFGAFKKNYIAGNSFNAGQILGMMAITPWLFIGFDAVPQLVKDLGISRRAASAMAAFSLLAGMSCYIMLNFSTGLAYGPEEAIALDWALGSAVMEHLGPAFFIVLIMALASAVATGINGFMICASRLIGAMARQNVLPSILGSTTERGVPRNSIIAVSAIGIFACFFGREVVLWVVDMCSFGAAVAYFYVCLNTFRIAEKKGVKTQAAAGAILSLFIVLLLLAPRSPAALSKPALIFLCAWTIIGIILFIIMFARKKKAM